MHWSRTIHKCSIVKAWEGCGSAPQFDIFHIICPSMVLVCNNLLSYFCFRVAQPIFLGKFILFFNKEMAVTKNEAYIYAGALIFCTILYVIFTHHSFLACQKIGMRIRVSCCSMIYRKVCFFFYCIFRLNDFSSVYIIP